MGYLYLVLTILFTVYGQLILKWRMNLVGQSPTGLWAKVAFILHNYLDIWIISGFVAAFFSSICWMLAMTKFELSYAYPFQSLSFVLVFLFSLLLFHETFTIYKLIGILLIVAGVFVSSR